jgi:hypothetical protein
MKEKLTHEELTSTFGIIRTCKQIGLHPDHQQLRARNEARLEALKKSGSLTENHSTNSEANRK